MTEQSKRRVGLIGTGGTISSIGRDSLDVWEYMDAGRKIGPDDLVARYPETAQVATIVPVPFRSVGSSFIGPADFSFAARTFSPAALATDGVSRLLAKGPGLAIYNDAMAKTVPTQSYRELWRVRESAFERRRPHHRLPGSRAASNGEQRNAAALTVSPMTSIATARDRSHDINSQPPPATIIPHPAACIIIGSLPPAWYWQAPRAGSTHFGARTPASRPGRPPCTRHVAEAGTAAHQWE